MKKYLLVLVSLCCVLSAAFAENPDYPELKKSDANIIGHVLDKKTKEHLPYITVALKGTTIGTVTDATGHYFLKNLPEGSFVLEVSSVGYKTLTRNVTLKRGKTLEEDFEIEEDAIALDGVVVSANRSETTRRLAPTLVNVVDLKLFETSRLMMLLLTREARESTWSAPALCRPLTFRSSEARQRIWASGRRRRL